MRRISEIPKWTLALNSVGTLALGLGVYAMFVDGALLVAGLDLRDFAWWLIIGGILLMLPLLRALFGNRDNNNLMRGYRG
ncbi:MAG: hypothetical protein KJO54_09960 [Gammaproteobacteria bacterium]|nr:hypothetical protein [Gammaproteobacteria bacterium]NNF62253.1 hypothetical protein [Gammaproteobacteria bacterium]NNM21050.1 hypothetical protein [Gammaproteobacteria bacterium]